ncbi:MAG TPA: hypothetical protein VFC73_00340 [Syntrophomonadaceae bacterium]|nr:hypothetical protein [Syntrophomonadaceae bacterium]
MKKEITYEEKIKILDEALKNARDERNKALASKEYLEKELKELNQRAEELGVNPEELDAKILEIKNQMDEMLEEIKQLIPAEYLKGAKL